MRLALSFVCLASVLSGCSSSSQPGGGGGSGGGELGGAGNPGGPGGSEVTGTGGAAGAAATVGGAGGAMANVGGSNVAGGAGLAAAAAGGGGSAGGQAGEAGRSGSPSGGGGLAGSSESFVSGDVEGVPFYGDMQAVSYWWSGIQPDWLMVEGSDAQRTWWLLVNNGPVSSGGCSYMTFAERGDAAGLQGNLLASYREGGRCNAHVTQAAPKVGDVLEGTFDGVLVPSPTKGAAKTVTNGRFRVLRIAAPPAPLM